MNIWRGKLHVNVITYLDALMFSFRIMLVYSFDSKKYCFFYSKMGNPIFVTWTSVKVHPFVHNLTKYQIFQSMSFVFCWFLKVKNVNKRQVNTLINNSDMKWIIKSRLLDKNPRFLKSFYMNMIYWRVKSNKSRPPPRPTMDHTISHLL